MQKITGSSNKDDGFIFDSLAMSKRLQEDGGYTRKQAETWVTVLVEMMSSNLATKRDVELIRNDTEILRKETDRNIERSSKEVDANIERLRSESHENIERLRSESHENIERLRKEGNESIERLRKEGNENIERLRLELKLIESRITIRLGGLIVSSVTVLAVLIKIL